MIDMAYRCCIKVKNMLQGTEINNLVKTSKWVDVDRLNGIHSSGK